MKNYEKLIIWDLDGVLVDSRELHYVALNMALAAIDPKYNISREEHLSTYDGLPTTTKLKILTEKKGLPVSEYDAIWKLKQQHTILLIDKTKPSFKLASIFQKCVARGYKMAIASNSIRNTVRTTLLRLGIINLVDYYQTNEDVKRSKPYPEMYWNCMSALNAIPATTVIVEDSHIGRQGALDSGAHLLAVENADDVTWEKVEQALDELEGKPIKRNIPWRDSKLNVVIPMAGAGSRFVKAGFTFPKPLIDVRGKPMIQHVIDCLNIEPKCYTFIVQREHYEKFYLKHLLNLIAPGCQIVQIDGVTEGAACTMLKAKDLIDNDEHLLMINSDQFIEWDSNNAMYGFAADNIDGGILTFESTHPKYSYVKLDENGFASEVVEKKVISNMATVGAYYWSKGSDFVKYAERMIEKDARVNGEFYVAPVYQEAIDDGKKIRVKSIESFWSLGTPEDLDYFLREYKK